MKHIDEGTKLSNRRPLTVGSKVTSKEADLTVTPAVTQRLDCSPGPKMSTFMPKDFDVAVQSSVSAPARLDGMAVWGMMPVHLHVMIQQQTMKQSLGPPAVQHKTDRAELSMELYKVLE